MRSAPKPVPKYSPSPEHKTHPGPWGNPQWHPRQPDLTPCPTDIDVQTPQEWLGQAIDRGFHETPDVDEGLPRYVYWYEQSRSRFFQGQRTQRRLGTNAAGTNAATCDYKGYPVQPADVPFEVLQKMKDAGHIDEDAFRRARRDRRHNRRRNP